MRALRLLASVYGAAKGGGEVVLGAEAEVETETECGRARLGTFVPLRSNDSLLAELDEAITRFGVMSPTLSRLAPSVRAWHVARYLDGLCALLEEDLAHSAPEESELFNRRN